MTMTRTITPALERFLVYQNQFQSVMAALDAAIHLARESRWKLDGRLKGGHDGIRECI